MKNYPELAEYIRDVIIPKYASFDPAHRENHALTVIEQARILMEGKDEWIQNNADMRDEWPESLDWNILLTAAACHDLGLEAGRENHHMDSGKIIRKDVNLRKWFSEEDIETIAQAAEDHRASSKSAPRSEYGKIVAEADRVIDRETIITRTIQFGLKNYPELDKSGHLERAVAHLKEKYGRGGYLKLWIPWSDNARRLKELQDVIADDTAIRKEVERLYNNLI